MSKKPTVVTLCGSSRFKAEHEAAMARETLAGKIVIPMGFYARLESVEYRTEAVSGCMRLQEVRTTYVVNKPIGTDGPTKAMLDELHLRKIDISDEVLVVNPGGYVGESTCRQIAYARLHGKKIRYTNEHCHAQRDGDCMWGPCPQERDGEPAKTGRHCPLDYGWESRSYQ